MRELFVYYRVRSGSVQAAQDAVVAMQRTLCATHDRLVARLLKRSDSTAHGETWMEIYATRTDVGAPSARAIDGALEAAIAEAARALLPFIDGERHVERFEAFDRP